MGYARSLYRDFESYLRIVLALDEDCIQLSLKQLFSNFVFYDLSQGIYTIKDISEAVYTLRDYQGTLKKEFDDCRMKTKLISKLFLDQHLGR